VIKAPVLALTAIALIIAGSIYVVNYDDSITEPHRIISDRFADNVSTFAPANTRNHIAVGMDNGEIHILESGTWDIIATLSGIRPAYIKWSPDDSLMLAVVWDGDTNTQVWRMTDYVLVDTLPTGIFSPAIWNSSGDRFTQIDDTRIAIWETETLSLVNEFATPNHAVLSPDFSAIAYPYGTTGYYSIQTQPISDGEIEIDHIDEMLWFFWHPDFSRFFGITPDGRFVMWSATTGEQLAVLGRFDIAPRRMQWSNSGDYLALHDCELLSVWDVTTLTQQFEIASPHEDHCMSHVSWHPDENLLLVDSSETMSDPDWDEITDKIWVIDANNGEILHSIQTDGFSEHVTWDANGEWIIANVNHLIYAWNLAELDD